MRAVLPCRLLSSSVIVISVVVTPIVARADNNAAAEALFLDGEQLVKAGNYAAACPKFEASVRLDPAIGARLHLADCHEHLGRTATAWGEYHAIEELARTKGDAPRETFARQHAAALEPRLLRLRLEAPVDAPAGMIVYVDRDDMTATLGEAVPLDPGDHAIEVSAPGYTTSKTSVTLKGEGTTTELQIAALEKPAELPRAAVTATPPAATITEPSPALPTRRVGRWGFAVFAGAALGDRTSDPGKGVLPGMFIGGRARFALSPRLSLEPGLDLSAMQNDLEGTVVPAASCPQQCRLGLWDLEVPAYLRVGLLDGPAQVSFLGGAYVAFRVHFGGADVSAMPSGPRIGDGAATLDAGFGAGFDLFVGHYGGQVTFQQGLVGISPVIASTAQRVVIALGVRW